MLKAVPILLRVCNVLHRFVEGLPMVELLDEDEIDRRVGLFDLDGTLANYEKSMLTWLRLMQAPDEPFYEVHARNPAYFYQRQCVIRRQPGFWRNLEPMELGFQVLRLAEEVGFRNFHACTRGPGDCPSAWSEKFEWVQQQKQAGNLPIDMKITITEDKGTIYGRFLCDDHIPFLMRWLEHRKRGLAILVATPSRTIDPKSLHPNIFYFDGTQEDELRRKLEKAFVRKQGEPLESTP
jgi:hypothetical protein